MRNEVIAVDPNPENQALIYNSLGNVPICSYFKKNRSISFKVIF